MGRRKIAIARVRDPVIRQVTFSKRRTGLFKKANELAILCGAEIAIVVFSPGNKPYSFGHPNVDDVASKFLEEEPILDDGIGSSSFEVPNREDLNQQLEDVLAELKEAENEARAHDEILEEYKRTELTQLEELKDSYGKFKEMVKSRLSDLETTESMLLLAEKPVVGTKNKVPRKKGKQPML